MPGTMSSGCKRREEEGGRVQEVTIKRLVEDMCGRGVGEGEKGPKTSRAWSRVGG